MRYISLSDDEVLTLQEGQHHSVNAVFRQRCSCLLLSQQGCRITQLATLYQTRTAGRPRHTIRTWFDRYEQRGIVGLPVLPGRKPLLQMAHQPIVEEIVATNRQSLGDPVFGRLVWK